MHQHTVRASSKSEVYITQTERSLPPLDVVWDRCTRSPCGFLRWDGRTQWVVLSAAAAKNRMGNAHVCTENVYRDEMNVLSGVCTPLPLGTSRIIFFLKLISERCKRHSVGSGRVCVLLCSSSMGVEPKIVHFLAR